MNDFIAGEIKFGLLLLSFYTYVYINEFAKILHCESRQYSTVVSAAITEQTGTLSYKAIIDCTHQRIRDYF